MSSVDLGNDFERRKTVPLFRERCRISRLVRIIPVYTRFFIVAVIRMRVLTLSCRTPLDILVHVP